MILELISYIVVAVISGLYYYFRGFKDGKEETEGVLSNRGLN